MLPPKSLKLEFSKTADLKRISRLFEPAVKALADPEQHVTPRLNAVFETAVDSGGAAFLSDENDHLVAMTIAYHIHVAEDPEPDRAHDHIEFGSSLSLMSGYKSTLPVIAALALREWLHHPPVRKMAANIDPQNAAALKLYRDALGWERIEDKALCASLDIAGWRTVPDADDPTAQTGCQNVPEGMAGMDWMACDGRLLAKQAEILLAFMAQGGLVHTQTGHFIPVDFSALAQEGLTPARLKAIAGGDRHYHGCR
jgi:hypothetical protein